MTVTMVEHVELTAEQCETFLEIFEMNPGVNHVHTLRELGVPGTAGQIRDAVNRQLRPFMGGLRQDVVRRELYRRAIDGVVEDVWHNGQVVGQKVTYANDCLIFLGKCTLPEARNQLDVNLGGADGGPVRVEVEGGRVSTISGVLALAASLGAKGAPGGLLAAADRGALPAASPLLPEAPDDQ